MRASINSIQKYGSAPNNGKSYIKLKIFLYEEQGELLLNIQEWNHNIGLIHIVNFEAPDRDDIGGSLYGSQNGYVLNGVVIDANVS